MSKRPQDGWVRLSDDELHPRKDKWIGLLAASLGAMLLVALFLLGINDSQTPRQLPEQTIVSPEDGQ